MIRVIAALLLLPSLANARVTAQKCEAHIDHPSWKLDASPWRGLALPLKAATVKDDYQNVTRMTLPVSAKGVLDAWIKGLLCDGWTSVHRGLEGNRQVVWLHRADNLVVIDTQKTSKHIKLEAHHWFGSQRGEVRAGLEAPAAVAPAADEIWRTIREDSDSGIHVMTTIHATRDVAKVTQRWTDLLVKRGWVARPRDGSIALTRADTRLVITPYVRVATTVLNIAVEVARPIAFWKENGVALRGAVTSAYPKVPGKHLEREIFFTHWCRVHPGFASLAEQAKLFETPHAASLRKAGWRKHSLRIQKGGDEALRWVYTRPGAILVYQAEEGFCVKTSFVSRAGAPLHPRWAKGPAKRLIAEGVVQESTADRITVRYDIQVLGGDPFDYSGTEDAVAAQTLLKRWKAAFKADPKVVDDDFELSRDVSRVDIEFAPSQ